MYLGTLNITQFSFQVSNSQHCDKEVTSQCSRYLSCRNVFLNSGCDVTVRNQTAKVQCLVSFKVVSVFMHIRSFVFQAVKLTSSRTQLPYEYYSLPFCKPRHVFYKGENLGKWAAADVWDVDFVVSLNLSLNFT